MRPQPRPLPRILEASKANGFELASEPELGCLLRTLAATKPDGNILELGTGKGLSTAWILDGMDKAARLMSVDRDRSVQDIAREYLGHDRRCTFIHQEGREFLRALAGQRFDMVFADAWSGKFFELEEALDLIRRGGLYVADDLNPLPIWPEGHAGRVRRLLDHFSTEQRFAVTKLDGSTGVSIAARR